MPETRSKSGISKPRQVAYEVAEAIKAKAPKANSSKPRTKTKVADSKVTKPKKTATKKATTTVAKKAPAKKSAAKKPAAKKTESGAPAAAQPNHDPTLLEKVEGVALTVQGYVMGKSGKKAAGTAKIRGTSRKGISTAKTAKAAA